MVKTGVVVDSDGGELPVTITNLSAHGFCMESDGTLFVGEQVSMRVGKSEALIAEIRWTSGWRAGGLFIQSAIVP